MQLTRAVKFEIVFPGWRKSDLFGPGAKLGGLYKELLGAVDDLRCAATLTMSALFQVRIGALPRPKKADGTPIGDRSLAYKAMNGSWLPFGEPVYQNKTARPVSSKVLLHVSDMVYTRLKTDYVDVRQGRKQLCTFRNMTLGSQAQSVHLDAEGNISLPLWAGRSRNRVTVRPRKLDASQWTILRRMAAGTYKMGTAALNWHKPEGRKGKWMISIAWTGDVAARTHGSPLIAGVHLGMLTSASVGYIGILDGKLRRARDRVDLPESAIRAWNRTHKEKKQRLNANRVGLGNRTGRGRQRKLRVLRPIGERVSRMVDDAVRQVAAAIVNAAVKRGAVAIAIEELKHWSVQRSLSEAALLPNRQRAARNRWYFTWHQGALRVAIRHATERRGLVVLDVSARDDSRTCHGCGTVWAKTGVYNPDKKKGKTDPYGRVTWNTWKCSCGVKVHADQNARLVVTQRGLVAWQERQAQAQAAK